MDNWLRQIFIIAEIGMNHDGSIGQAKAFIKAAAEAGVDAVKFQLHIFEAESLPDAPVPPYFKDESRKEFFERTAFSKSQWRSIKEYVENVGLKFICSPFSIEAIEILEEIGTEIYKVPSGEVSNLPYLETLAKTGKPILLSSGMSTWEELGLAIETLKKWNENIVVLQCSSLYPCPYDKVGLNILREMKERYGLPVGLSDHTLSIYASLAAVVLGAQVIERHFTLSRKMYGPDARFSLEPGEMKALCDGIRSIETMLSHKIDKDDISDFEEMKEIFEKSIVARREIKEGDVITPADIMTKKPGTGIRAKDYNRVIGKKARRSIPANTIIRWDDLEDAI